MIYEYRFNISLIEFGLIGHPSIRFLGATKMVLLFLKMMVNTTLNMLEECWK